MNHHATISGVISRLFPWPSQVLLMKAMPRGPQAPAGRLPKAPTAKRPAAAPGANAAAATAIADAGTLGSPGQAPAAKRRRLEVDGSDGDDGGQRRTPAVTPSQAALANAPMLDAPYVPPQACMRRHCTAMPCYVQRLRRSNIP